jgi:hypothetical protein
MTSRPSEPYSLAANIGSVNVGVASGIAGNDVFKGFSRDFIKPETITKFVNNPTNIPSMYNDLNAIGFFDSLHDFKSDFIDCQGNIKGDEDKFSYKKFAFTFLLNGGYTDLLSYPNLIVQNSYSYLHRLPRPLDQDNLENYFSIGNILDVITTQNNAKGNMYILPNTRSFTKPTGLFGMSGDGSRRIYDSLVAIYQRYADPSFGNKIKLMFDFQLNLFDIIRKNKDQNRFCLLYTAETITDPAPKMKFDGINDTFGYQNFYFENLGETGRTYNAVNDNIGGNINVTFKNLRTTSTNITKNTIFTVEARYAFNSDGTHKSRNANGFDVVQMNSKANTIDTIKNIIRNTIERVADSAADTFNRKAFTLSTQNRVEFYTSFNSGMSSGKKEEYKKDYAIYYARKRLGDTLQGRICKLDKLRTLSFNSINSPQGAVSQNPYSATTDAVLVTHDRMLFSYAVISRVPVILDLKEHMILYIPPLVTRGGGQEQMVNKSYPIYRSLQTGGVNLFDPSELNQAIDSIMNDVSSFIRFLYFFNDNRTAISSNGNFRNFIRKINSGLQNRTLTYKYLGQYATNILIIGSNSPSTGNNVNDDLQNIIERADPSEDIYDPQINDYPNNYSGLAVNSRILLIRDGDNALYVDKYYSTSVNVSETENRYYLRVNFIYNGSKTSNLDFYPRNVGNISTTIKGSRFIDELLNSNGNIVENLSNLISETATEDQLEVAIRNLYEDISSSVELPTLNIPRAATAISTSHQIPSAQQTASTVVVKSSKTANQMSEMAGGIMFILMIVFWFMLSKGSGSKKGGGIKGNILQYGAVLNANFDTLYDETKLLENNVTVFYFLFSLLQEYELNFVNYQEGIDTFYTKINENSTLSDMIGETNLIPHNIEMYVFLKLILNDYSQENLNSINYSLFEYYFYLYSLSKKNVLYSRLQRLKSYLDIDYTINVSRDNISDIAKKINSQPTCLKSWKYFISVMDNAEKITNQIIAQNYDAEQSGDYNVIYQNVDKYNLKLCGFTEMKNEFIMKTINILSDMAKAGLLGQYESILNQIAPSTPDLASGIKPYQIIPQSLMQPIAVSVGGKKSKTSLKKIKKVRSNKNTKKIIT